MDQPRSLDEVMGKRVIVTKLGPTTGMLIVRDKLANRKEGARGMVSGIVAGHGGDVWWVRHDDGTTAAYGFDEVELDEKPAPPALKSSYSPEEIRDALWGITPDELGIFVEIICPPPTKGAHFQKRRDELAHLVSVILHRYTREMEQAKTDKFKPSDFPRPTRSG